MLVMILPFFLAANIAVDEPHRQSEWAAYGPECTYDVLVNTSLANVVQENDNFCATIATELKCRPKGYDILACHFQNSRIKRPDPEDAVCTNARDFVPTRYKFVDEEPFEIRFNSRGIENLVVHRTIARWKLDMIKVIVSQLNIGFEMEIDMEEHRDKFTIMENSTVGYCEVDVKITQDIPAAEGRNNDSIKNEQFQLKFIFMDERKLAVPPAGIFHIEKTRQPKRCPRRTIYFFGDHEDYSRGDRQLYMDMTNSMSHITISKDKFESYTISEGIMKTTNNSRIMRPHQNISLKLKRIDIARSPLPDIQDPASTSLFAFSNLRTIPENE